MTSNLVKTHQPCPNPTCGSSDAYSVYDNGQGHCFSCGHHTWPNKKPEGEKLIYTEQYLGWRGITKETFAKFGVKTQINQTGEPIRLAIKFPNGVQYRWLKEKKFLSEGDMSSGQLFGQDRFPAGSSRSITIYEGALDAMSGYQMMGGWPSVSVRSSSSARKDCSDQWEYLNSFEEIILAFDSDEPGKAALKAVAPLFDFNKVKFIDLSPFKDANDFLTANKQDEFKRVWYNARRFMPDEVISTYSEIDDLIDNDKIIEGVSYPWPRLQRMTYGMRPGEFVLLTAQEGIGKTEFMRAVEHHVLKSTDTNIGIIHLEEPKARAIKGLVGYELGRPVHMPSDDPVDKEIIKQTFRTLTKRDERVHIYSHFGSDDIDAILGIIQFLAGPCECKFIFLDHISIVVSGTDTDDERKSLDYFSTRLKMLAESHGITLVCVSHVNDDNKTRGSRNISKVADLHVFLDRNPEAEDEYERNTTQLLVRKNRFGAQTGPADKLHFSLDTFMLTPEDEVFGIPTGRN